MNQTQTHKPELETLRPPSVNLETVETTLGDRLICFSLRGRVCCVPANAVAEVVQPMNASPVPAPPKWLLGLGHYRGEPVALINPAAVIKGGEGTELKPKTIVFRSGGKAVRFGLPIDTLHEVVAVHDVEVRTTAQDASNPHSFELDVEGRSLTLILPDQLFDALAETTP